MSAACIEPGDSCRARLFPAVAAVGFDEGVEDFEAEELVGGDLEGLRQVSEQRARGLIGFGLVVGDHEPGDAGRGPQLGLGQAASLSEGAQAGAESRVTVGGGQSCPDTSAGTSDDQMRKGGNGGSWLLLSNGASMNS